MFYSTPDAPLLASATAPATSEKMTCPEKALDGEKVPGRLHLDFSFADAAGDRIIWEHLGMMHDEEYVPVARRFWHKAL